MLPLVISSLLCITGVRGHVGLTFPPARKFDLDFLDNVRTKPPCGMPKGDIRTSIKAGTKFNVTWHLGYPHQGGFRLELLGPDEKKVRDLTPTEAGPFVIGDTTAQSYMVDIPADLVCSNCTIRLIRQALEWSEKYLFWSCADIDIVQPGQYREDCSGHGKPTAGRCRCDRLYYGERCQYQDECLSDEDCGRHGKCVDVDATTAPRKQCFCQLGYFGPGCAIESPVKGKEINEGLYTKREISPSYTLFWRILSDVNEIEIAIRAKGTGFVGIGWRPKSLTKQCQKLPKIGPEVDDDEEEGESSEPGPEPESEPESSAEPEPETEKPGVEGATKKREARTVKKSLDVSIGFVKTSVSSARKKRQTEEDSESEDVTPEPIADDEATTQESEIEATTPPAEDDAQPVPEGEPESSQPEPEADEAAEAEPEVKGKGVTSYTPRGEFHSMDCVDMVIGMARGDSSRIWDYYTRDRSTPRRDTYWGGTNDVTGALGFERDGETTIIFRKRIKAKDFTDHEIINEEMHVIWAVGQEPGDYSHIPKSGLESNGGSNPSVPEFYKPDELKYHGKKNRGTISMNFFDEVKQSIGENAGSQLDFCGGEWKHPRTCNPAAKNCEYFARWAFDEDTDKIHFTVQSRHTDLWTGIGFSDTPLMSLTDAVIGFVEANGRFFIMDMWTTGYLQPILESSQDLTNLEGIQEDGITTLKFSRARNTKDKNDVAFTNDNSMYMIFPVKGGRFNAVNKKLKKHEETPIPSSERISIKACRTADGRSTFTTTPKPAQIMYQASLKFVNLGDRYILPVTGTKEYTELQNRIAKGMRESTKLANVPGFTDVLITKIRSANVGEFTTDMVVVVDKDIYDAKSVEEPSVEQAFQETVQEGRIGILSVDPTSLQLRSPITVDASKDKEASEAEAGGILSSTKLYIVIACIVALLLIALIQATCTIYKITRKPLQGAMSPKDKLAQSAWKDYSVNGGGGGGHGHHTNYAYEPFDHPANASAAHANDDLKRLHLLRSAAAAGSQVPPQHLTNGTLPRPTPGARNGAPLPPNPRGGRPPQAVAANPGYSLPRPNSAYGSAAGSYGSYDRRIGYGNGGPPLPGHHPAGGDFAPDHYFMPSQRKMAK